MQHIFSMLSRMKNPGTWYCLLLLWWQLLFSAGQTHAAAPASLVLDVPGLVLSGVPFSVTVRVLDDADRISTDYAGECMLLGRRAERGSGADPERHLLTADG